MSLNVVDANGKRTKNGRLAGRLAVLLERTVLLRDGALFVAGRPVGSKAAAASTSHFVEWMEVWN